MNVPKSNHISLVCAWCRSVAIFTLMPLHTKEIHMDCPVLVIPGHGDSGPAHWQSIWQARSPHWHRLQVEDWNHAVCNDWVAAIDQQLQALGPTTLVVAHSLGCLALVHWAARHARPIRGALLVAVPDPSAAAFPAADSIGFTPLPLQPLSFRSTVVTSTNDPYGSASYARACATAWRSEFVEAGARGHLNSDSGLGDWPDGHKLLEALAGSTA